MTLLTVLPSLRTNNLKGLAATLTVKDNVAWVVGIEKVYAHRANGDLLDISALATNIFERRSGKWLLVHHHASRMP